MEETFADVDVLGLSPEIVGDLVRVAIFDSFGASQGVACGILTYYAYDPSSKILTWRIKGMSDPSYADLSNSDNTPLRVSFTTY